jgi:hypothetical protein
VALQKIFRQMLNRSFGHPFGIALKAGQTVKDLVAVA